MKRLSALVLSVLLASCATWNEAPPEAPSPEELPPRTIHPVDRILETMSTEELIGQRFIGWLPRTDEIPASTFDLVRSGAIGGFILYPWNYETADDVRRITSSLAGAASESRLHIGLFFAADQEGGRVAAFRFPSLTAFPPLYYLGTHDDPAALEAAGYLVGTELRDLGVNMNLAPVLDIAPRPDATIIGDRSLGSDPQTVARLGVAYVNGIMRAGVIPVGKHFPGHGMTPVDSHGSLPVVDLDREEMEATHLIPFKRAIDAGIPALMTAHILFPKIDPDYPSTLSVAFVDGLLRDRLGFDGVVISDGLSMGALASNYDIDTVLERCVAAGVDILLVHARYDIEELTSGIVALLESGRISREELILSARRILSLKYRYGLLSTEE